MEYALILFGGLLGSSHCVGMCGGFALSIGATSQHLWDNTLRQAAYSCGRVLTYAFLGAVVGFAGARLKGYAGTFINISATLSILAGTMLVFQGLVATGWLPWKVTSQADTPCLMGTFLKSFLLSERRFDIFVAGILTGFLPCGLVYAFLTLAAASGHFLAGMLIMTAFGLGTIPLMLTTGLAASILPANKRLLLLRTAAVLVVLVGILTLTRGVMAAATNSDTSPVPCPFCHPEAES